MGSHSSKEIPQDFGNNLPRSYLQLEPRVVPEEFVDEDLYVWSDWLAPYCQQLLRNEMKRAYHLFRLGKYEQSRQVYLDILEQHELKSNDETQLVLVWNQLAAIFVQTHEFNKATEYVETSIALLSKNRNKIVNASELVSAYLTQTAIGLGQMRWDDALMSAKKALYVANLAHNGAEHTAAVYCELGKVYQARGEFDKFRECCQHVLLIVERENNNEKLSASTTNVHFSLIAYSYLAIACYATKQIRKAIQHATVALSRFRQIQEAHQDGLEHEYVGLVYNILGLIYLWGGKSTLSIDCFQRALAFFGTSRIAMHRQGIVYSNLVLLYTQNDSTKAAMYADQALELFEATNVSHTGIVFSNLACAKFSAGHTREEALALARRARERLLMTVGKDHPWAERNEKAIQWIECGENIIPPRVYMNIAIECF